MVIFHFLSRILPHLPTLISLSPASGLKMSHNIWVINTAKTNPWTWSGAPHLAKGLCPFGITANLIWRPRHWAVWRDPGTNTWLLFRQNARQNVFNWVLCSHFPGFRRSARNDNFSAKMAKYLKSFLDTNSSSINSPLFKHFWTKWFVCCHWFQFWWWLSLSKLISFSKKIQNKSIKNFKRN